MRYHQIYSLNEFPEAVREVTKEFFESNPWQGAEPQRLAKFQAWYSACCEAMGYDNVHVVLVRTPSEVALARQVVSPLGMFRLSVIELFHAFRHDMIRMGHEPKIENLCEDCVAWSYSLYYSLRTNTFCKAVRAGKIPGVTELDLIPADDVGCVLSTSQRDAFEGLAESFVDGLGDEDHELMDLMAQIAGEGS